MSANQLYMQNVIMKATHVKSALQEPMTEIASTWIHTVKQLNKKEDANKRLLVDFGEQLKQIFHITKENSIFNSEAERCSSKIIPPW